MPKYKVMVSDGKTEYLVVVTAPEKLLAEAVATEAVRTGCANVREMLDDVHDRVCARFPYLAMSDDEFDKIALACYFKIPEPQDSDLFVPDPIEVVSIEEVI